MQYKKEHLPVVTRGRRSGQKLLRVGFIVAHDVGNPNSTARNNRDFYTRTAADTQQSAHVFVDDIEAIELVPLTEKAWHVMYDRPEDNKRFGDDANDIAISIEMCYFTDKARTLKAYENYVNIIAGWMKTYSLTTKEVAGHFQLDPARRTDPVNAFKTIGKTWDGFLVDLEAKVKPPVLQPIKPPSNAVKIGTAKMSKDVHAYARAEWGTQTGAVVKKGESRNIYASKNGWYQLFSGEWLPIGSGENFEFVPVETIKPQAPKPSGDVYRVLVDGKQVGAYGAPDNVLAAVEQAIKAGNKKIALERV